MNDLRRCRASPSAGVVGEIAGIAQQFAGAAYAARRTDFRARHPVLGHSLRKRPRAVLRGLTVGSIVAGGVAAVGAILAVLFLPAQP